MVERRGKDYTLGQRFIAGATALILNSSGVPFVMADSGAEECTGDNCFSSEGLVQVGGAPSLEAAVSGPEPPKEERHLFSSDGRRDFYHEGYTETYDSTEELVDQDGVTYDNGELKLAIQKGRIPETERAYLIIAPDKKEGELRKIFIYGKLSDIPRDFLGGRYTVIYITRESYDGLMTAGRRTLIIDGGCVQPEGRSVLGVERQDGLCEVRRPEQPRARAPEVSKPRKPGATQPAPTPTRDSGAKPAQAPVDVLELEEIVVPAPAQIGIGEGQQPIPTQRVPEEAQPAGEGTGEGQQPTPTGAGAQPTPAQEAPFLEESQPAGEGTGEAPQQEVPPTSQSRGVIFGGATGSLITRGNTFGFFGGAQVPITDDLSLGFLGDYNKTQSGGVSTALFGLSVLAGYKINGFDINALLGLMTEGNAFRDGTEQLDTLGVMAGGRIDAGKILDRLTLQLQAYYEGLKQSRTFRADTTAKVDLSYLDLYAGLLLNSTSSGGVDLLSYGGQFGAGRRLGDFELEAMIRLATGNVFDLNGFIKATWNELLGVKLSGGQMQALGRDNLHALLELIIGNQNMDPRRRER